MYPFSVRVVATFSGIVLFPSLCSVPPFFPQYIDSFLYPIFLFPVSVSKISYVLLQNIVPLFFSTQTSLPKFNVALAVMLWILDFVSLFICFPKCLRIAPFILLCVCNSSVLTKDINEEQRPWENPDSYRRRKVYLCSNKEHGGRISPSTAVRLRIKTAGKTLKK